MSQVSRFGALGRAWRARPSPLRSNDGLLLLESFLVAAVISVLVIRWFLTLADFPRLGSGGLHIAHMLWGGAFMLVAILLLLAYLDRPVQHAAAFIAGLGFGTFIDEIGKFVTTDNDYFFRPAVSLIYVVFVVVFLVAHALVGQRRLTEREALANALDLLEPRLGRPIEGDDRGRIEDLLDQAGRRSGLVDAIARYLDELPSRPDEQSWWETIPRGFARRYAQVAVHPLFSRALTAVVLLYTAAAVVGSLLFVVATVATDHGPSAAALGQLVSTLLGAALVVRGVLALPTSHIAAYRWFLRGVLVWLLITQVFIFYDSQPIGLAGLALDLIAYAMLRYAISHETARSTPRGGDPVRAGDPHERAAAS